MIAAAWWAGVGLVRVRDFDIGTPAAAEALQRALAARAAAPAAPILILTPGFVPTLGVYVRGDRDPLAFLQDVICRLVTNELSCTTEIDPYGNVIFTQCPPRPLTL
jgi:hypothetical protein